jgi:polyisoprenoid-binding protein YceI
VRAERLIGALLVAVVMTGCSGAKDSTKPTTPSTEQGAAPSPAAETSHPVKAESSKATYTVEETFVGKQGVFKAVGTTSAFEGALDLKAGVITGGTVKVDLRTLKSDSGQRDRTLQGRFLESEKYPYATFVITGMEGGALQEGKMTQVTVKGKMTIHGTEKELAFKGEGGLSGGLIKLNLQTNFNMTEFGITVPDLAGMLKAEDPVLLAIEVTAGK